MNDTVGLAEAIKECLYVIIFFAVITTIIVHRHKKKYENNKVPKDIWYSPTPTNNQEIPDYLYDPYELSQEATQQAPPKDFTGCYEPRQLLTWNEWQQYKVLDQWAQKHRFKVLVKVRLADLIHPRTDTQRNKSLFWKIQAKHVDFVIINANMQVKCIVELMDNSHKALDRQERDEFMQQVLNDCGYKTLFTYAPTEQQLNQICGIQTTEYEQQHYPLQ